MTVSPTANFGRRPGPGRLFAARLADRHDRQPRCDGDKLPEPLTLPCIANVHPRPHHTGHTHTCGPDTWKAGGRSPPGGSSISRYCPAGCARPLHGRAESGFEHNPRRFGPRYGRTVHTCWTMITLQPQPPGTVGVRQLWEWGSHRLRRRRLRVSPHVSAQHCEHSAVCADEVSGRPNSLRVGNGAHKRPSQAAQEVRGECSPAACMCGSPGPRPTPRRPSVAGRAAAAATTRNARLATDLDTIRGG